MVVLENPDWPALEEGPGTRDIYLVTACIRKPLSTMVVMRKREPSAEALIPAYEPSAPPAATASPVSLPPKKKRSCRACFRRCRGAL